MKFTIFQKSLILAIVLHAVVFIAVYFGLFGVFNEIGGQFCEAARDGLIKQPVNTFSNIGFAILGVLAAYQLTIGKFKNANAITSSSLVALFFTSLMVALSPGSMAMHATETYMGGYFDMLSMYLITAFMLSYAFERLFFLKPIHFSLIFFGVLAICHLFHFMPYKFPLVGFGGNFIFALFLILSFVFELINHFKNKSEVDMKWAFAGVGGFVLSFLILLTGRDGHPWCHPYSFMQAHAVWHILDAVALYLIFRFYVSENDERYISNK